MINNIFPWNRVLIKSYVTSNKIPWKQLLCVHYYKTWYFIIHILVVFFHLFIWECLHMSWGIKSLTLLFETISISLFHMSFWWYINIIFCFPISHCWYDLVLHYYHEPHLGLYRIILQQHHSSTFMKIYSRTAMESSCNTQNYPHGHPKPKNPLLVFNILVVSPLWTYISH